MNSLITIASGNIGGTTVQTTNARDLHVFLEVGKDFSTWIKDRIEQYDFLENQDFVCSPILGSEGRGGHNRKDYHLTLDMAKELSMVERNERGKEARQYFIECERQAKTAANRDPMEMLNDPAVLRQTLLGYSEKVLALESMVAEQAPMIDVHNRLADARGSFCLRDSAKSLQMQPSHLNRWLELNRWIYRRPGKGSHIAYQDKIQSGYLLHKMTPYEDNNTGENKVNEQVRVTPKGLTVLARKLNVELGTIDVPPYISASKSRDGGYVR